MNHWAAIQYRDFWDVPRIFLVAHRGRYYLFDCAFDDAAEDYPDSYRAYLIPNPSDEELSGSWDKLHEKALHYFGEVSIGKVRFDPSNRRAIDTSILNELAVCGKVSS